MADGEYTAASVDANQAAAEKLDLVKEKDGNYGTTTPASSGSSAPSQSSSAVLAALAALSLGGK